ncbi:MAG: hypothetical protein AB8B85_00705 [Paracoccaceae bacterium]
MKNVVLALLAFGFIGALSTATLGPSRHVSVLSESHAAGPTLAADLGAVKSRGAFLLVEARFRRAQNGDMVKVLPISLKDGEAAAFSLPGYPEQTFRIKRAGATVLVEVKTGASLISRLLG